MFPSPSRSSTVQCKAAQSRSSSGPLIRGISLAFFHLLMVLTCKSTRLASSAFVILRSAMIARSFHLTKSITLKGYPLYIYECVTAYPPC